MKKNWQTKLGVFLMVFSGVFFGATFLIPILDLPTKTKVIASTASLILMEVVFGQAVYWLVKNCFRNIKQN